MLKYYILKNRIPVVELDLIKWGQWFEKTERQVKNKVIGDSRISTVFLGLDHNFNGGEPILWETMVFGGELDLEQDRCSGSWEQAEAMHARMIEKVKECSKKLPPKIKQ